MKKNILHVGLDVDDKAFHGTAFYSKTGEIFEFSCRPNNACLLKKLQTLQKKGFKLHTCYEATYIGYSLHRFLMSKGIQNSIIAPSLIPKNPGKCVKTDRIDSKNLAIYFSKELLTAICVPDKSDEEVRDVIRSRSFLVRHRACVRRHILSLSRRQGLNYREEKGNKSHWTGSHTDWLFQKVKTLSERVKSNIGRLLEQEQQISQSIQEYDEQIVQFSKNPEYKRKAETLCCFRGIDTLSAMTLIIEIGDIRRFATPRKLSSYAGFDVREYSSGGKERKFNISKLGNKQIRTTVVEACQQLDYSYRISRRLKNAREGQLKQVVDIADKCIRRLRKRFFHLYKSGKQRNKIKVACAREYLSFIWEALREVS